MKKGLLLLSLTLSSCSSMTPVDLSWNGKKAKSLVPKLLVNNKVLSIPSKKLVTKKKSRGLASVHSEEDTKIKTQTNKKLYFLSLYKDYINFKALTPSKSSSSLNHCPSFHSEFLDINTSYQSNTQYNEKLENLESLDPTINLELALPVEENSLTPIVFDLIRKSPSRSKEIMNKAFVSHTRKIKKELVELCQTGTSTNYYIYENLIGHIKANGSLPANKSGMETLLKSTVFSNMAIMKSPSFKKTATRGLASSRPALNHEKELLERAQAKWFNSYFEK